MKEVLETNSVISQSLTSESSILLHSSKDKYDTLIQLPKVEDRKDEGGLRTRGRIKETFDDKPLVTVITVVYNGRKYIEGTIQSVLNQTYDNVEYIIIDGGSTDGTLEIIQKFGDKIDYWVSEKDKGIYDAMNKGIKLAAGVTIGIIHAGDKYLPQTIEKVTWSNSDLLHSVVTGDMIKYLEGTNISFMIKRTNLDLNRSLRVMPINHPSTFIGRGVYKKIGLFDSSYKICGDNEFIVRARKYNFKFIFLEEVLSKMQLGGISEKFRSLITRTREHYRIRKTYEMSFIPNLVLTLNYFIRNFFRNSIKALLPKGIMKYYYNSK